MSGLPSGLTPISGGGALPQGLTPIAQPKPTSTLPPGLTALSQPTQPQQQNQDPAGFRKYLTSGGIYSQNPSVNVMQDYATNYAGVPMKGGITPAFRSIVTQLTNQGNKLGVYDFNAGHTSLGAASPHAQGRAADFDTINGEPVGTHLSPNLGTFINQALQTDPRVRVGVPKEIFNQLGGLTGNGRIFVDDPAHIHIELDPMAAAPGKAPAVQQFKPDQPKPGKPIEAGIGDALKNAGSAIEETGKGFFKGVVYEMGHPLESYSDVEGVLQRAVTGYLSKAEPPGSPVMQTKPELIGPAIGQAIYDAFHPHSSEVQSRDTSAAIKFLFEPYDYAVPGIGKESSNVWAHFGQAIAAQTASDPFTYLMPILSGGRAISAMSKIADGAEGVPAVADIIGKKAGVLQKLGNTAAGKFVDHYFGIRPELNEYLDQHAKDARMMFEDSANAHIEPQRVADEKLMADHGEELRNVRGGSIPVERYTKTTEEESSNVRGGTFYNPKGGSSDYSSHELTGGPNKSEGYISPKNPLHVSSDKEVAWPAYRQLLGKEKGEATAEALDNDVTKERQTPEKLQRQMKTLTELGVPNKDALAAVWAGGRAPLDLGLSTIARKAGYDAVVGENEIFSLDAPISKEAVGLPDVFRQRYLQEGFVEGTPEMRQQALDMGYRPQPGEAEKPPTGLKVYNLRQDYQTMINPPKGETQEEAFQRISGGESVKENAGFEKERTGDEPMGEDQYDRTENRLRLGRNLTRRRMIDQRTQAYLDKYGGWKPNGQQAAFKAVEDAYKAKHGAMPQNVNPIHALSDRAWSISTPVGNFFNKLSRESIKAFPFPHAIGNVGQLAWNKGGWTAVGKGLNYAVRGLSDAHIERLKSLGLWADYLGKDMSSPWRKPPLSYLAGKGVDKAIDYSTQILNRLEGGFRQALLDLADHQHGFDPGKEADIFRVQPPGSPEVSPLRNATYYAHSADDAKSLSSVVGNKGGETIGRVASAKNPLEINGSAAGAMLPAVMSKLGVKYHGLENALTTQNQVRPLLPGLLESLGVPREQIATLMNDKDLMAGEERAAIEVARQHGYDAIRTGDEYIALHPSAASEPHGPNLANEAKKAKDVRDAIGDYANVSKVVATLQGVMGAPFVAFGLSIVPKAMLKAIKEHPERLAGNARMNQDLQADHGGPLPAGVRLGGGPNEAFARMVTDPIGYLESPSRIGPAAIPLQIGERLRHKEPVDPSTVGGEMLQSYGGVVGNVASGALGLAHPAPGQQAGKPDLRAALLQWMTGRYMGTEPSEKGQEYFNQVEEEGGYPKRIHRHHFSQ